MCVLIAKMTATLRTRCADILVLDSTTAPAISGGPATVVRARMWTSAQATPVKMVPLAKKVAATLRRTRIQTYATRRRRTDRRWIGTRIGELKRKLREVAKARAVQRKSRAGLFRVALVGYTNAGKSSLLRTLSGADLFVEDRLFATLDSATRSVDLGGGYEALATDTVGFIRKLPHHLIASFRSTLEESREADILLHVIDSSHPDWEEQREVVLEVLDELSLADQEKILVFNKTDRIDDTERESLKQRIRSLESTPAVFVSAHQPETLEALKETLRARIRNRLARVAIRIPVMDGEAIATVYREGEVIDRVDEALDVRLTARLPEGVLGRLTAREGIEIGGVE